MDVVNDYANTKGFWTWKIDHIKDPVLTTQCLGVQLRASNFMDSAFRRCSKLKKKLASLSRVADLDKNEIGERVGNPLFRKKVESLVAIRIEYCGHIKQFVHSARSLTTLLPPREQSRYLLCVAAMVKSLRKSFSHCEIESVYEYIPEDVDVRLPDSEEILAPTRSVYQLNSNCLEHVFSYLTLTDLSSAQSVCRKWRSVIRESFPLWRLQLHRLVDDHPELDCRLLLRLLKRWKKKEKTEDGQLVEEGKNRNRNVLQSDEKEGGLALGAEASNILIGKSGNLSCEDQVCGDQGLGDDALGKKAREEQTLDNQAQGEQGPEIDDDVDRNGANKIYVNKVHDDDDNWSEASSRILRNYNDLLETNGLVDSDRGEWGFPLDTWLSLSSIKVRNYDELLDYKEILKNRLKDAAVTNPRLVRQLVMTMKRMMIRDITDDGLRGHSLVQKYYPSDIHIMNVFFNEPKQVLAFSPDFLDTQVSVGGCVLRM